MPKKRRSSKSEKNEQANGSSESHSQSESNVKSAKLDVVLGDTTWRDLPAELVECILVKVVAMEVRDLKLAKAVWKGKADLVIDRLRVVCSQWSSILSTTSFQIKLHRILDGTAQDFCLEIVQQVSPLSPDTRGIAYLGDETFLLYENRLDHKRQKHVINVYSGDNMADVRQEVRLSGGDPAFMTACNVSNCVYVRLDLKNRCCFSIYRISKDAEHQYKASPWECKHKLSVCMMSVTASGNLVIFDGCSCKVGIYNGNGTLQHEIALSSPLVDVHRYVKILQKSNGNVVLAYVNWDNYLTRLLEIDMSGIVVRQFDSSYSEESCVTFADIHDRILITPPFREFELLDSELNLIGIYSLPEDVGKSFFLFDLHFDSVRDEVVRIHWDKTGYNNCLTRYRLTEI